MATILEGASPPLTIGAAESRQTSADAMIPDTLNNMKTKKKTPESKQAGRLSFPVNDDAHAHTTPMSLGLPPGKYCYMVDFIGINLETRKSVEDSLRGVGKVISLEKTACAIVISSMRPETFQEYFGTHAPRTGASYQLNHITDSKE